MLEGDVIFQNIYFDNGEGIDSVALDGDYKAGFSVHSGNQDGITYTYEWTPTDKAGQRGETFSSVLVLMIQQGLYRKGQMPLSVGCFTDRRNYRCPFR